MAPSDAQELFVGGIPKIVNGSPVLPFGVVSRRAPDVYTPAPARPSIWEPSQK